VDDEPENQEWEEVEEYLGNQEGQDLEEDRQMALRPVTLAEFGVVELVQQ
jgi:hypothetical protein